MKDTIWIKKGRFTPLAVVLMFAFPLVTALICLCFGRMSVPIGEVLSALRTALTGESTSNVQNYSIVINLRLPRILTAIIVGAGLSCAGNTYQSLFSNPLATPDILGVTSGTCVGAILAIILSCSILETQLIALVFGLISVCFTLKVAGKSDGRSMVYLVLAGTIASSLFNALGSLLKYTADPQDKLPEITYWLLGSFTSASFQKILIGCPLIVAGIIIIYLLRWRLNILSLSDDEARASGINIKQTRMLFIVASTLITASAVSMCGQVGWIGLLIPHASRMLVGSNNRYVVPLSLSLGASFMLIVESFDLSIVLNYGTVRIIKDVLIIDINIGMKKGYFVIISLFIISFKAIRHIMVAVSIRKLLQRFAVHLIRQLHLNGQELLNHRIDCLAEVRTYCKCAES